MKSSYVYIVTNKPYGTLYIGVTSDIIQRAYQHREAIIGGFTKHYNLHQLVYFETYKNIISAIEREKQLKNWNRAWKISLIEKSNPTWKDLYHEII